MTNPYRIDEPFVLSFSGGRTSGLMLYETLQAWGGTMPPHGAVIFCNTGKERPETLDFIERCSLEWAVNVIWLEYRRWETPPDPGPNIWTCKPRRRNGQVGAVTGFEVVNYATASRDGRPFDDLVVAKKILPDVVHRHCTQWMKIKTSWRYARNILGWKTYLNCIGLRHDEPRRVAKIKPDPKSTPGEEPYAPMNKAKVTRQMVMDFWQRMRGGVDLETWLAMPKGKRPGWDLALRPDEGNCDLCFLKGQGKLLNLMRQRPEDAEWWIKKEQQFVGRTEKFETARFRKNAPSYAATLEMAQQPDLFTGMLCDGDDESVDCHCTD